MSSDKLTILYRGALSGCNYKCPYCPFAEKKDSKENVEKDKVELAKFVAWVEKQSHTFDILFTPLGEALIHKHYQEALISLSKIPNVEKVVIQTNLSCSLEWIEQVNKSNFALWCSFHPSQVDLSKFLEKCQYLHSQNISFSVGCVGVKENFDVISNMRSRLNPETYLWINAYKHEKDYYSAADIAFLTFIDPLFELNNKVYLTQGKACKTGHTVISLKGNGDFTRCHFNSQILGNIYNPGFESNLHPRLCENKTCHCYIGYIFLEEFQLDAVYKNNLARIPGWR
jgi:MoaA/NifB/PqqE/SkfB family radical SAM enzyme